ncbi:MAG: leucyl aminopeptidase family protein [Rhodothalassiaceae bacterium]
MPASGLDSLDFSALASDATDPAIALRLVAPDAFSAFRAEADPDMRALIDARGLSGKGGEALLLPGDRARPPLAVGLLEPAEKGSHVLLECAARIAEALPAGSYRLEPAPETAIVRLFALGWLLAHYRFRRYFSNGQDKAPPLRRLLMADAAMRETVVREAEAVALVRDLVNMPANDMQPSALEAAMRDLAARHGAAVEAIVGDDLLEKNLPAIHTVGRAAADAPRLVDLRWGDPEAPRVTLVGKGVCFDSGGLDIKSASGMRLMKKDMGGAAHAMGLAHMIMAAGLPLRLRVLVPAVENAVGAGAFRPGDIIATRKGLSVEIGNTDAEGRLILADALALADEETPELLLDFATLTGAARVALGPDLPALFTPDDALAQACLAAGQAQGDPLWRLPLWQPYRDDLQSSVADLLNASESGFAGAVTAALFLESFIANARAWAHVDLFAWNKSARPGRPAGGEAMAIRAFFHMIAGWLEHRGTGRGRR